MNFALHHVSAISLFVEDLSAAKQFYRNVFDVDAIFEDQVSIALRFDNLIINLRQAASAADSVEPHEPGAPDAGSRFQLSVRVFDIDVVCARLRGLGVAVLAGPKYRSWGIRTINFVDPAGHSWEIAQKIGSQ